MKKNNSKNLQVGDIVEHQHDGAMGRVKEVEYNDADECEVDWWGSWGQKKTSRTSICYLNLITVVV